MIHTLSIAGYRSLKDFELRLSPKVTVVQGSNGVGKSNLYKSLRLFASLAEERFAQQITSEGGTPSCFWAGDSSNKGERKEVNLDLKASHFSWKVTFGLVPITGFPSKFQSDPDLKKEILTTSKNTIDRNTVHEGVEGSPTESLLTLARGSADYPEISAIRDEICNWRFYDFIRTDNEAPARRASARYWSPLLDEDAGNLPSVIQTIRETGKQEAFDAALEEAFPSHRLEIVDESADTLSLRWHQPDLLRPLSAKEVSDGTLKYIALLAALFSPRQSPFLVLNEPENSLNRNLYSCLGKVIAQHSTDTQMLVITHASDLASEIENLTEMKTIQLVMDEGATRLKEDLGAKKVWRFD